MTEDEYIVMDELYFVISYSELQSSVNLNSKKLKLILQGLWEKGWLRCYEGLDNELDLHTADISNHFDKYHYLASKEGLMAHNSR